MDIGLTFYAHILQKLQSDTDAASRKRFDKAAFRSYSDARRAYTLYVKENLHRFIGYPTASEFSCVEEASKDGAGTIVGAPPVFNKKQSLIDAIEIDQDWLARMFDVKREASPAGGGTHNRSMALGHKLKYIEIDCPHSPSLTTQNQRYKALQAPAMSSD